MKRKTTKRLAALFICIILILSLGATAVSAEEASENGSEVVEEDGENIFEEIFRTLEAFSSEILCALSFAGSLMIAFAYKKGLIPTVKNGIGAIGNAIGAIKENSENCTKHQEELLAQMSERLEQTERALDCFGKAVSDIAEKAENSEHAALDRAEMKALMSAQIDMLYDIFMTSSLPQYQKDALSEKIRSMKEVSAVEGKAK